MSLSGGRSGELNALGRLSAMARQRPGLSDALAKALAHHPGASQAEIGDWADATLRFANVNVGPAALLSAFRIAALAQPRPSTFRSLAAGVSAAAEICRCAGASPARAVMEMRAELSERFDRGAGESEAAWWSGLVRLAREAPALIATATTASATVLDACGGEGFELFVGAALGASMKHAGRAAFLALDDPEARLTLSRLAGRAAFSSEQRRLAAFATALWGVATPLRPLLGASSRRVTIADGIVLVPDTFADPAPNLFRAAVAHATAHLAFGSPRREIGSLKPAQLALVGLVEDARVEALAMRRFPGLRRLWAPFHVAEPSVTRTAPALFVRLARTLFDPDYEDGDGFVAKGRSLFAAETDLADPELSRRVGGLIGNDLGQMRIPFNPNAYVVEPAYRDDNLGFWNLPPPSSQAETSEAEVDAVRPKPEEGGGEGEREGGPLGRARPTQAEPGAILARYPEWDRASGRERPEWATVREAAAPPGAAHLIDEALDPPLLARINRLVRSVRVGRPTRLKRQPFGIDLDLDAAVDAAVALRVGQTPDERLHQRRALRRRDLAALVLLDVSESTRDRIGAAARSVLDIEKLAVAALARAMSALGDRFALCAFASIGREHVRFVEVKAFGEPFDRAALARLAGLEAGFSTRLGAALRHAGAELAAVAAERKLLLVLTDGSPSDIDMADPVDLVEDARRAALGLKAQGIDVFGLTLCDEPSGEAVFGRRNTLPVRRVEDLPGRLSDLYFRLAR